MNQDKNCILGLTSIQINKLKILTKQLKNTKQHDWQFTMSAWPSNGFEDLLGICKSFDYGRDTGTTKMSMSLINAGEQSLLFLWKFFLHFSCLL